MITTAYCYDPIRLQQQLSDKIDNEGPIPSILISTPSAVDSAALFYHMIPYLNPAENDVHIQNNLIYVHFRGVDRELQLMTVISFFHIYYTPMQHDWHVIGNMVYSSINWTVRPKTSA